MLRFILAQLRGRPRRALALLAGLLAATTGFVVISGSTTTAQVQTTGTVQANYRAAYDVLVRPKGSRTGLEDQRGLVGPNHLSGLFGGITTAQLAQVRDVRNVEVAAPIAMLGFSSAVVEQAVDLTDVLDPTATAQMFRLTPSWVADRGLTVIDDAPEYVYVTRNSLYPEKVIVGRQPPGPTYEDGTALPARPFPLCYYTVLEVHADGAKVPLCAAGLVPDRDGTTSVERTGLRFWQIGRDGKFSDALGLPRRAEDRLIVRVGWRVMVLAAAIDPPAEAALVGLDHAVVEGRYLRPADRPVVHDPGTHVEGFDVRHLAVPALVANTSYVDEQVQVSVRRMDPSASAILAREFTESVAALAKVAGSPVGAPIRSNQQPRLTDAGADLGLRYQPGGPTYQVDASQRLRPQPVPPNPRGWRVALDDGGEGTDRPPVFAFDLGFRPIAPPRAGLLSAANYPRSDAVGVFDPVRLRSFSPLSAVPLETYQPPGLPGADARSRQLLGGRPLLPTSNPAGYLSTPPLILTNLGSLDRIPLPASQQTAPLSAIRVRVAGVTGMDPVSKERVRVVAGDIAAATGLDVDITLGSSPSPQQVILPEGRYGRPELALTELWSRKGVAVAIIVAADHKSLVLSGLTLLVCVLFLANAVAAAVRDRRRELAVLACLGWPARRLAAAILGEVALVGLAAGVTAAGVSLPIAHAAGVSISLWRAALAIPIGPGLALLAAVLPALSAARAAPGAALAPSVRSVGRGRHHRTVFGQAMSALGRIPGRTLIGVLALAVGVCALTVLIAVLVVFHNDVVGTLLGDAVAVRVRPVDVFASIATLLLGVFAVGDVLYINVRERAAELAALWAAGWTDSALVRLIAYEGLGIGILGGFIGATAGLLGVTRFVGQVSPGLILFAAVVAVGAAGVACLAAVVPAIALRRLPLATLLAEE
jgi:putative ABC transport system permease protein